jgi:uncharacterized membrane protein YeaQ/YmgE (transglycosylase-associated protein family)
MSFLEISLQNFILWVIVGATAGYYLHLYDKRKVSGGVVLTSLFAAIGALSTGYLVSFISGKAMLHFSIEGFLVSAIGAALLAYFYRFSFSKK